MIKLHNLVRAAPVPPVAVAHGPLAMNTAGEVKQAMPDFQNPDFQNGEFGTEMTTSNA